MAEASRHVNLAWPCRQVARAGYRTFRLCLQPKSAGAQAGGLFAAPFPGGRVLLASLIGVAMLLVTPRIAWPESTPGASPEKPNDSVVKFDFDDPPDTKNQLTRHLTFGGKINLNFDYENNYDLDRSETDDLATLEPELEIAFSYDPASWFRGFLDLEFKKEGQIEGPEGRKSSDAELIVKEAFVNVREFLPGLSLTLGRQEFKDEREWLYDEELDGVRLFFRGVGFGVEASVSREALVGTDVLNERSNREINNYFLLGRYALGEDSEVSSYLFFRDDRTSDKEDLIFLGLRSMGVLTSDIDYWVEAAHVRGSEDGTDISGFGFDVGATYVFDDTPLEPSLTLGFAFGTGDDSDGGTDRNFRQTDLQDNNDRFNGVTGFKYYGEVLDPELSNLFILTAGFGIRPTRRSSIDLIYHHYSQHQAVDELRDVSIDADPDGRDRTIGNALDLIVGYREIENFDVEAIFGLFAPGAAFSNDADTAYFVGIELEFEF